MRLSFFHIISLYCTLIVLVTVLTGCIRDDLNDCIEIPPVAQSEKVTLQFLYDHNPEYKDLFTEEVDHLSIFVYDEMEKLCLTKEIYRIDMISDNTVELELNPGNYTLVAWGNCDTDDYNWERHEELSTMRLFVNCIENNIVTARELASLFHTSSSLQIKEGDENVFTLSMVKNNNKLKIIVTGITVNPNLNIDSYMEFRVKAPNGDYNYSNNHFSYTPITYLPYYTSDSRSVSGEFHILRLYNNEDIVITIRTVNEFSPRITLERPLIPYLIRKMEKTTGVSRVEKEDIQDYLDRMDEFELSIRIELDGTITIDEWDIISQPGIIGG